MKEFSPITQPHLSIPHQVAWQSPSNIALVKYWGKYDPQLPANPSVSLTLNQCRTNTSVWCGPRPSAATGTYSFEFLLSGTPKPDFHPKIEGFFHRISSYLPFLTQVHLRIESENTFPHSSGIASSASAMSALALCLWQIARGSEALSDPEFYRQASYLARLGSGSACRSIWGPVVVWGETPGIPQASQEFGWASDRVHPVFADYQDTILLIDQGQKSVSSTVGHQLMVGHPFAEARFKQAHDHLGQMMEVLAQGDLDRFVDLVEREALTLHALMMASNPSFVLMKPATLAVIEKIRAYRKATQNPVCFTLDAGANVHVLYPKSISKTVLQWIQDELVVYCEKESYICDTVGSGSSPING